MGNSLPRRRLGKVSRDIPNLQRSITGPANPLRPSIQPLRVHVLWQRYAAGRRLLARRLTSGTQPLLAQPPQHVVKPFSPTRRVKLQHASRHGTRTTRAEHGRDEHVGSRVRVWRSKHDGHAAARTVHPSHDDGHVIPRHAIQ